MIQLQTNALQPLPTKLERKYLKDVSQLDHRYTLAKATHQVSVFTQGILAMRRTILGIIKLDPRQLLEDGIRRELVRQLTTAMHGFLVFKTGSLSDFESRLTELGRKLDGFRQSFEYISDYIGVYGLKIWQEEMSRIIHYSVEQECNSFLRKKVYDRQSRFQSDAIPIPNFAPVTERPADKGPSPKAPSVNFTGRLTRELLAQTDPKNTVYVESMQGWYDQKGTEVVGIRTFSLLHRGQCTTLLMPLDHALSPFFLSFPFSLLALLFSPFGPVRGRSCVWCGVLGMSAGRAVAAALSARVCLLLPLCRLLLFFCFCCFFASGLALVGAAGEAAATTATGGWLDGWMGDGMERMECVCVRWRFSPRFRGVLAID